MSQPAARLGRLGVPALAVLLLGLAAAAAAFSTLQVGEVEQEGPQLAPRTRAPAVPPIVADLPPSPPATPEGEGLGWLGDLLLVGWLVAALVGLVLLLRVLARRRGQGKPLRDAGAVASPGLGDEVPLLAAVDAGLVELSDDDQDPRRAVIACWVRLEEAAAAAGVARHDADTAGDLVVRLLRARQVSEPVLAGLAEVYREARYATHTVDARMRTHARSALRRLREELMAAAPAAANPALERAP